MTADEQRVAEQRARQWYSGAGLSMVKAIIATSRRELRWYEPRDLPAVYWRIESIPHGCGISANRAAQFDRRLTVCLGYGFRWNEQEAGYVHCWNVDAEGRVVDLAVRRLGKPDGYLGIELTKTEAALVGENGCMTALEALIVPPPFSPSQLRSPAGACVLRTTNRKQKPQSSATRQI